MQKSPADQYAKPISKDVKIRQDALARLRAIRAQGDRRVPVVRDPLARNQFAVLGNRNRLAPPLFRDRLAAPAPVVRDRFAYAASAKGPIGLKVVPKNILPQHELFVLHNNLNDLYGGNSDELLRRLKRVDNGYILQSLCDPTLQFVFNENMTSFTENPLVKGFRKGSFNAVFYVKKKGEQDLRALRVTYLSKDVTGNYRNVQFNYEDFMKHKKIFGPYLPDYYYYGEILFEGTPLNLNYDKKLEEIKRTYPSCNAGINRELAKLTIDRKEKLDICQYTVVKQYQTDFDNIPSTLKKYEIVLSLLKGLKIAEGIRAIQSDLKTDNIGYYVDENGRYNVCFIDTDENTWTDVDTLYFSNRSTKIYIGPSTFFPAWSWKHMDPNSTSINFYEDLKKDIFKFFAGGLVEILIKLFFDGRPNDIYGSGYWKNIEENKKTSMRDMYVKLYSHPNSKKYPEVAQTLIGGYNFGLLAEDAKNVQDLEQLIALFESLLEREESGFTLAFDPTPPVDPEKLGLEFDIMRSDYLLYECEKKVELLEGQQTIKRYGGYDNNSIHHCY